MINDNSLYTGIDGEPESGIFGNEVVDKDIEKLLQDQRQLVTELTPKLQSLISTVDTEIELAIKFIADYVDNTKDNDVLMRGELKAAARYRQYLRGLKTKFTLDLAETKKK